MKSLPALNETTPARHWGLVVLAALNMVPLVGVLSWGWQSFDLIFLYWLENVVIGVFVLARIVIRPAATVAERVLPWALGAFFLVHYGLFCYGHGSFVVGLFGPAGDPGTVTGNGNPATGLIDVTREMLSRPEVLLAFSALVLLQLFDWLKDIREHGFGAISPVALMTSPYRRIVVLHVAIIGSGFLLAALHEPIAGLSMLVIAKTLSDLHHWRRGEAAGAPEASLEDLTEDQLKKLEEEFAEPKVTVNGETRYFGSFAELKASSEFRTLLSMSRLIGAGSQLKFLVKYLDKKIAEEQAVESPPGT